MSEKITYHPEPGRAVVFDVLSKNADGTVNVGTAEGVVVVSNCAITEDVVIGSATASRSAKRAGEADASLESKKVDELRDIAEGLGIDPAGLKKQELIDAIFARQSGGDIEL